MDDEYTRYYNQYRPRRPRQHQQQHQYLGTLAGPRSEVGIQTIFLDS